jgi:ATP-dependent Clp protease ATP-binding subunit ClpX
VKPTQIYQSLQRDLIGQEETLRFVSVALFKHLQGEKFGNLLLIGSSGTGKTTIMRAIERFYAETGSLEDYRVVIIMNAHTLASDEGAVDTHRLFVRLEERARQILGPEASAEEIGRAMERATVCFDEVDKISATVGGKPYVTGITIQQTLLTLIEGEHVLYPITTGRGKTTVEIDTGRMLFLCAGAFEGLYDLVYRRVTSPATRVKLPTETLVDNGKVTIREIFALRHHFRQEDLFEYGMQPQFLSRFDNAIILDDLSAPILQRIFLELPDGVFQTSRDFFRRNGIQLAVSDAAARAIALEAVKSSRIGARALKAVWGRIIKPFEFDPDSRDEVGSGRGGAAGRELMIDEKLVAEALKAPY